MRDRRPDQARVRLALRREYGAASEPRPFRMVIASIALTLLVTLAGCDDKKQAAAQSAPQAPAVVVAAAERQAVAESAEFVGRVEALEKVEIRARVTGFLGDRYFQEGQMVKQGDKLFSIDRSQFEADVAIKAAKVQSAQASLNFATFQVDRGRELVKTNALPQATLDQRLAEQGVQAASVAGAQADLRQALITLGYTEISSPIEGRVGRAVITRGNVVSPESTPLTVVVRQDPIRVTFPVSQRQLLDIRRETQDKGATPVLVKIRLPDGSTYDHVGRVNYVDVQTDKSTDTALVQAEVENPDGLLSDGQFLGITVEKGSPQQLVVIPESAVQVDQAGTFVLAVGADNKVEQKRVKLGRGPAGQSVVESGIDPGTLVIVEGAQRARPGSVVAPRPAASIPGGPVPAPAG